MNTRPEPTTSIVERPESEKPKEDAYTVLGKFRKIGREIDPGRDWGKYSRVGFYSKDEEFEMISGTAKKSIIAGIRDLKHPDQRRSFEEIFPSEVYSEKVESLLKNSLGVFSSNKRAEVFVSLNVTLDELLKRQPPPSDIEIDSVLVNQVLDFIPNIEEEKRTNDLDTEIMLDDFFTEKMMEQEKFNPDPDYQKSKEITEKKLRDILKSISEKFDKTAMRMFLDSYLTSSRMYSFDGNYKLSLVLRDVWATPFFRERNKGFETILETQPFPTVSQVTNSYTDKESLQNYLEQQNFTPLPQILPAEGKTFEEEVVDVESVVGMSGCDSWIIQDVKNSDRGLGNIWNLAQKFQKEDLQFNGNSSFIKGIRYNGKIWIFEDGRNRFAALKALGVKQVPLLIIEGEESRKNTTTSIV